jgi:hypothetical protein
MLKGLLFHQTEKDAAEISSAVFKLNEFENLLGAESYFQKPIGQSGHCLTPEDIVVLVFLDKQDAHLQECSECFRMYQALKDGEIVVAEDKKRKPYQPVPVES